MSIHNDRLARFCNHVVENLKGYNTPAAAIVWTALDVAIDQTDREDEEAGRLPRPVWSTTMPTVGERYQAEQMRAAFEQRSQHTAEQMTHRFLVDLHEGDVRLVDHWRKEADRRWYLTLQLVTSLMDHTAAEQK
jgi:hypothetical protein